MRVRVDPDEKDTKEVRNKSRGNKLNLTKLFIIENGEKLNLKLN